MIQIQNVCIAGIRRYRNSIYSRQFGTMHCERVQPTSDEHQLFPVKRFRRSVVFIYFPISYSNFKSVSLVFLRILLLYFNISIFFILLYRYGVCPAYHLTVYLMTAVEVL